METLKRLKEIRKQKKISSDKLGELVGLSGSAIRNIEAGRRKIKLETLEKIAQALGVSVAELLSEPRKEKPKTVEDIAWEMVEMFLEKSGKKVDAKTKRKMYEFALLKLKQTEEDINEIIKLLGS